MNLVALRIPDLLARYAQGNLRSIVLADGQQRTPSCDKPVTPLSVQHTSDASPDVLSALYSIRTTPYENSFLSRLRGIPPVQNRSCLAVDWANRTPWMDLMQDIRDHFRMLQSVSLYLYIPVMYLISWHM